MVGNIFPYEQIEKNSDIILWGAGKVCREFRFQIEQTGYCNIVGIVDSNAQQSYGEVHPITFLEDKKFDYIVITIENEKIANSLKESLLSRYPQIPIITVAKSIKGIVASISAEKLLDQHAWEELFSEYREYGLGNFGYLQNLIEELKQYESKTKLKEVVKSAVVDWSNEKRLIFLRLLLKGDCFDDELMFIYHQVLDEEKNNELTLGLLYETSWQELSHPEYRYADYYIDRKKLLGKSVEGIICEYDIPVPFKRKNAKGIKRIVFLRHDFPQYKISSATRNVVRWANEATNIGCEVLIVSYNFFDDINILTSAMNFQAGEAFDANQDYLNTNIKVYKSIGSSIHEKIKNIFHEINEFSPDLIISTCSYYEALSSILYQFFPTIDVALRGVCSSTYAHRYVLSRKSLFDEENQRYHCIEDRTARFVPFLGVKIDGESQLANNGIMSNNFICATISNRLEYECSIEFVDGMAHWLREYANTKWILVGTGDFQYIKKTYADLLEQRKIILWGYEKELEKFLKEQEIRLLIYPKVTGNGNTIAMAIRNGVPVLVSKANGDADLIAGPVGVVEGELVRLFERLKILADNQEELRNIAKEQLILGKQFLSLEQGLHEFVKIGYEILEEF